MNVVIVTGGVVRDGKPVREALAAADLIIAADSGAETALKFSVIPSVVIGDMDSLDSNTQKSLRAKGSKFIVYDEEKDASDTELAIEYALENGAREITILGGIEGDRIDHIVANIGLLRKLPLPVRFVNGSTIVWAATGPTTEQLSGRKNDIVSLLPLTDKVTDVTTHGLYYHIEGETLYAWKSYGIHDVLINTQATVEFATGTLLFVHIAD